jgi:2-phospho-L-lactate guanylyltransferase
MPYVLGSRWVALVPIKRLAVAKTRLRGAVAGIPLDRLVLAMAIDTVTAVLSCPGVRRVLVVTDDPTPAAALSALGAECVRDEPAGGLNAALEHAARHAVESCVVALTADLPALRTAELSSALEAAWAAAARVFVPDAGGTGTVLLAAPGGAPLRPRFGDDSAAAHASSGALRLDGAWPSLRRDVDTGADLDAAIALGLGRHSAAVVGTAPRWSAQRGSGRHSAAVVGTAGYGDPMQGTVATFEPVTGAGTVLLDDGSELEFPSEAFVASGLRLLRLGQRIRLDRDDTGQIVRVALPTMP